MGSHTTNIGSSGSSSSSSGAGASVGVPKSGSGSSLMPSGLGGEKQSKPSYYFDIGSIESFERKLEIAQRELGVASKDFVPVQYTTSVEWGSVVGALAPTLLIVAAYFFFMNKMGGGAGGGGGMSSMFKVCIVYFLFFWRQFFTRGILYVITDVQRDLFPPRDDVPNGFKRSLFRY
jgi:hypothetical protein